MTATVASLAQAQESAVKTPETEVVQQLAQINTALREIAVTLARQVEHSRLDLIMKRTQIALGDVERSEAQLQTLETERTTLEDQRSRLAEQAETIAATTEDIPATERDALNAEIAGEQKRVAQRLRVLEGQIVDLENRLAARREELRDWQAVLDRRLTEL